MAGGFALEYVALDSTVSPPTTVGGTPGVESANANQAIADADCMVYMGTYNSGAAKISIPIMNEAGMAMISFANTYSGSHQGCPGSSKKASQTSTTRPASATTCRVVPADDIQGALGAQLGV